MPDTPRPGGGREATYGAMAGRPDHEDFWKLSDIVVARDRTMDLTACFDERGRPDRDHRPLH
jgi:hypothetical protein